jgi:hypothetical protein
MSLDIIRGLACECGLDRLGNGHSPNSFSYRSKDGQLWFIYLENTDVAVRLLQRFYVVKNGESKSKQVFVDKYSVSLYEPTSVVELREVFKRLKIGGI